MLACTSLGLYMFKERIIDFLIGESTDIRETALQVIWLISFNTFPDGFKGMLKGVIKALGIQDKCVYVNITGHWFLNLTLLYLLPFYFEMGILGMWTAKLVLEWYIFIVYYLMISLQDWDKIVNKL
jgi:Na+-driven multidrug efflux pump